VEQTGVLIDLRFEEVLAGVRRVGAAAAERADELDRRGQFPPDLFNDVVATGCMRAMLPRAVGGLELSLAEINELIIEASRANGSLGWLLMIGTPAPLLLGMLPAETVEKLMAVNPIPRTRGAIAPKGVAVRVEGGYRVSGQWPFASGGPSPDLIGGNCLVMEDGAPRRGPSGAPEMVVVMVPAEQAELLDTWHVLGLKGTDSCDFALRDVFVPEAMTMNLFTATNRFDTPITRLPLRVALATGHSSVAIGIAQGALDELAELAKTKRAAMNPAALLADDPVFRHALGEQALRLASVRAFLDHTTETAWQAGLSGRPLSPRETIEARTMAGYITAECVKIVDFAYTMAGSVPVYDGSSLQRRLRDMHVATQHVGATGESYRLLGALLVGQELSPMDLF
jgi:alkylation response protein AidB-like acyl-CoA dehydrogenase